VYYKFISTALLVSEKMVTSSVPELNIGGF
jgi:hypothetical protein